MFRVTLLLFTLFLSCVLSFNSTAKNQWMKRAKNKLVVLLNDEQLACLGDVETKQICEGTNKSMIYKKFMENTRSCLNHEEQMRVSNLYNDCKMKIPFPAYNCYIECGTTIDTYMHKVANAFDAVMGPYFKALVKKGKQFGKVSKKCRNAVYKAGFNRLDGEAIKQMMRNFRKLSTKKEWACTYNYLGQALVIPEGLKPV